ncbi:MAG: SDR family oxidoreductase [Liquorilactobacillus hordei]
MSNKIAVVTGGASGIGAGMVKAFFNRGCTVIILDVQDDKGKALALKVANGSGKIIYKHCDLFDYQAIQETFEWIAAKFKKIDYAMNNAGFGLPVKPLAEVTPDELRKVYGICLIALTDCMIEELKIMSKAGFGRIVNTASGAGIVASQGGAVYSAAKAGVIALTKSAALDYVKQGITVNAIAPGAIETELVASLKETSPETYAGAEKSNPIGRFGQPEDIANATLFLCQGSSSFINGVVIPVDSGFAAGNTL